MEENKEIPKDLTMLQSGPEPDEVAFEKLLKNPPKRAGAFGTPSTVEEAESYVKGLQEDFLQSMSMQDGNRDLDLDQNQSMFEDTNTVRARNQSEGVKGLKAFGGGLLKGALVAAEQLGYVGDLQGVYERMLDKPEGLAGNWWSDLMKQTQDDLGQSEAFKIYEEEADQNSLTSQIFKWSSLESALSSAVGFGLTGLGAASLVSKLGSLGKFKELAKLTDIAMGNLKGGAMAEATLAGGGMTGATAAFVGPLAASAMSNYFMGQMMATDTYNQILESLDPMIKSGKLSKIEAQKIAATEAQDVVYLNMSLTAVGHLKFGNIFKNTSRTKGLVENPTALYQIKQLVKTGSPVGFLEEVTEEMSQMEQIHDANREVGLESEYSDNYWDRMTQMALSNRAMHAGALGMAGGPFQFALIQRPLMGQQIRNQKELYQKQQATKEWAKTLTNKYFETFENYAKASKEALSNGNPEEAAFIDDLGTIEEIAKKVEDGTLSILKKDIEDIINSKEKPEGYDDNYKEIATSFLNDINTAQAYLSQFGGAPNRAEIIQNAMIHDRTAREIDSMRSSRVDLVSKLTSDIKASTGLDVMLNDKAKFDIVSTEVSPEKREELKQFLNYNKDFNKLKSLTKNIIKYEDFRKKLFDKNKELTSENYQKEYEDAQKKAKDNFEEEIKNKVNESEKKSKVKAEAAFDTLSNIKKNKPDLTEEQLAEMNANWDKEVGTTRNKILPTSFTSRDNDGTLRTFTPGELIRSIDGRHFLVQMQEGATNKNKKGRINKQNKAQVLQTDENGKVIKGSKPLIIDDHSFLRSESLLPVLNKDGSVAFRGKQWGNYVFTDSILKPNDVNYQLSLTERADRGELAGVNVMADLLQTNDYKWLKEYNHHLLNEPFINPYEVSYKVKKVGEHEVYIDVYKKVEGKSDILLTRLNKDANVNYRALIEFITLNGGEVAGKAINHYSSKYNLVKNKDEKGNIVYRDLKDLRILNPKYLIDNQIILAQTKGKTERALDIARGEDGKLYTEGYITHNGKTLNIPYNSMNVGDTYALILSPGGEIIPIALSADRIENLPSQIEGGTSFVDDVIVSWESAIQTWLKDELKTEAEDDKTLRELVNNDPLVSESRIQQEFAYRKSEIIYKKLQEDQESGEKENSLSAILAKTVGNHVRSNWVKYRVLGEDESGAEVFQTKKSKRTVKKVVRENYFDPTIAVSKTTGKFSPAIKVRNPKDHSKIYTYILEDEPEEFRKLLGKQRKRASINTLANASLTGAEAKNLMKNFIEKEGLTVDINPVTPFLGSSGTFTVNDPEFLALSKKSAYKKESYLEKEFGSVLKEMGEYKENLIASLEERIADFNQDVEEVFANTEWLENTDLDSDPEIILARFTDLINTFNINEQAKAISILKQYSEKVPEDLETDYNNLVTSHNNLNNVEAIAKGLLAIEQIRSQINSKELTLKSKNRIKSLEDPTGKFTQPEGLSKFEFGTGVYHEEFGEGKFKTELKNGKYRIILKNGKERDVYPSDTFLISGNRAELFRTIKKLGKTEENSAEFKSLTNKIKRLEATIVKDTFTKTKDNTTTVDSMENILEDQLISMGAKDSVLAAIKNIGATNRANEIVESLKLMEPITSLLNTKDDVLTLEELTLVNDLFTKVIPYTVKDLDALIKLAETQIENKVDEKKAKKAKASFISIKSLIKAVESYEAKDIPAEVPVQIYSFKTDDVRKTVKTYLGRGAKGSVITGQMINLQLESFMSTIQDSIAGEVSLRQTMFVSSSTPNKAPTTTATKNKDNTEVKKPQTKKSSNKTPESKTPLFGNSFDSSDTVNNENPNIQKLQEFNAPKEVLSIIEAGNYKASDFKELIQNLNVFKDNSMDYNPLFEDFIRASENSPKFKLEEFVNQVNYSLKSIEILQSDKAKQIFEKGKKNGWDLNKILTELQIPKEQKQIILDKGFRVLTNNDARIEGTTEQTLREEIITSLLADNSFVVEVNTSMKDANMGRQVGNSVMYKGEEYKIHGVNFDPNTQRPLTYDVKIDGNFVKIPINETTIDGTNNLRPTQHYSNLTVPGGTNYTENEIATPSITPSIKGHAQFSTDKGIGWFRSDDKNRSSENQISLGKEISYDDPYIPASRKKDFKKYEVLNENGNNIGTVVVEYRSNKSVILHPKLDVIGKGYGKKLYKHISSKFNVQIEEWNEGAISNSNSAKKMWDSLEKEGIAKRIFDEEQGDNFRVLNYSTDVSKTRRILEVQSDLFQKGRDKENLVSGKEITEKSINIEDGFIFEGNFYKKENNKYFKDGVEIQPNIAAIASSKAKENIQNKPNSENQFLQLLNKDNNWVTFFIKSIIQDSAKKGYEKVLFPTGNTASKIEGHTTLEEFKKQKEDRIKFLDGEINDPENIERRIEEAKREKEQIKQELERVEKEGFGALKPIYNFYENTVTNILKKNYNVKEITDEFGNTWNEVSLKNIDTNIKLKSSSSTNNIKEQFNSEVEQVKKMLPQVPIEILENVTSMVNKFGARAIGAYHKGVQYLVKNAKQGTAFHEAFHAVADLYLSSEEKLKIAKEHGKDKWDIALEEKLAEEFEKYVNKKPWTVKERVLKFFKSIMDWFTKAPSLYKTEKVFNKIVSGGYAKSMSLSWRNNIIPLFNSIDQYKANLSKENALLLQSLLDSNKIEIVC